MAAAIHLRAMRETNSPLQALLVHPSRLQHFIFAPCVMQTLPLTAPLAQLLWLQRFTFAPCLLHTPPCWTWFVHPLWLQPFRLFATMPCLTHIPPLTAVLVQPLWRSVSSSHASSKLRPLLAFISEGGWDFFFPGRLGLASSAFCTFVVVADFFFIFASLIARSYDMYRTPA